MAHQSCFNKFYKKLGTVIVPRQCGISAMPQWHVYIVECSDNSYYTGIALDLEKRIKRHNDGQGAKYTRSHRPVKLIYTEEFDTRLKASRREIEIKKLSRLAKDTLVNSLSANIL